MTSSKRWAKNPTIHQRRIFARGLILLLAATLFIFSGAVAGANYGTIFPYELSDDIEGTWSHGSSTITAILDPATGEYYFANSGIVEGQYSRGNDKITVKYPYAAISGMVKFSSGSQLIVSDGGEFNAYQGTSASFEASTVSSEADISDLLVTYPNGVQLLAGDDEFDWNYGMQTGEYKINAVFDKDDFVNGVPADFLVSKKAFTFKAVRPGSEVSVVTDKDAIVQGKAVAITVTGVPGVKYTIDCDALDIISTGTAKEAGHNSFIMPVDGKAVVYGVFTKTGTFNVNLVSDSDEPATISYEQIDKDKIPTPAKPTPANPTPTNPTPANPTATKPTATATETPTVKPTGTDNVTPSVTPTGTQTPTDTAKSPFSGAAIIAVVISGIIACVVCKRRG